MPEFLIQTNGDGSGIEILDGRPLLAWDWLGPALNEAPVEPEWLWHGYLARGFATLLVGLAKTGKTTLLCGLLQALAEGGDLLGQPVSPTGALILTEQNATVFRETVTNFGFGFDEENVGAAFLAKQDRSLSWDELISDAVEVCLDRGFGLLVVDTFARWASFQTDNDAPEIIRALGAIDRAKGAGIAVLIVHHSRKAGGEHTEEVSGPVALAGGVDIVLSLRRAGEHRVLTADGRSMDSPERVTFGLKPYYGFSVLEPQERERLEDLIVIALANADGPLGYAELIGVTARPERSVKRAVSTLLATGRIVEAPKDGRAKRFRLT